MSKMQFTNQQGIQQYDQLIQLLINTLSKRVLKFYNNEDCNENAFLGILNRILAGMKILEQQKFTPPKFSEGVKPLQMYLNKKENSETEKLTNHLMQSNGFECISQQTNIILNNPDDPLNEIPPQQPKYSQQQQQQQQSQYQYSTQQQPQHEAITQDYLKQIEENVTKKLLDRFQMKKKRKPKQFLFRQLLLDTDLSERSQSFQHRRTFHSSGR